MNRRPNKSLFYGSVGLNALFIFVLIFILNSQKNNIPGLRGEKIITKDIWPLKTLAFNVILDSIGTDGFSVADVADSFESQGIMSRVHSFENFFVWHSNPGNRKFSSEFGIFFPRFEDGSYWVHNNFFLSC